MFSPDTRLLAFLAAFTAAGVAGVFAPALVPLSLLLLAALVAAVLVDGIALLRSPALGLDRLVPERAAVGRPIEVALRLENRGARATRVDVVDELPRDMRDRDPRFAEVELEAGEEKLLHYEVTPRLRGDRPFGVVAALERSPLGLLRRRALAGAGDVLPVYPDTSRFLRPEALDPRRVLATLGLKRAPSRGEGMDFESLRDYVPGDDPRRIDWRATARRGRLVTRLHQHERNHTVVIAVDASRLMAGRARSESEESSVGGGTTKLDCAVDAALALAYAALYAGDRAGLAVFDRGLRAHVPPRARRGDLGRFVDALRSVQPELVEADYAMLVRELLARQQRRCLIVVLTDFVEAAVDAMHRPLALLARRHRVLLVAVRDPLFDALSAERPPQADRLYRRIVLDDLLREREAALTRLRRAGLHTLDLPPTAIIAGVLNRYLALRYSTP